MLALRQPTSETPQAIVAIPGIATNTNWTSAPRLVRRLDKWTCQRCGVRPPRGRIEVNHIVLRDGSG